MRVGFIDCASNLVDVFEPVSAAAEAKVADLHLVHVTAPDLGKVPVCAKRLFDEGCDSVIAFATATSEEAELLHLVHDKVMDVEIDSSKFVFMVVVFDDEARTPQDIGELAVKRVEDSLEHMLSLAKPGPGASDDDSATGSDSMGDSAKDLFSLGEGASQQGKVVDDPSVNEPPKESSLPKTIF